MSRSRPRFAGPLPTERLSPATASHPLAISPAWRRWTRNTVLRALRQLRDEGLLDVRRGRGATVVASPEQGELRVRALELVRLARRHGYAREEVVELIRTV